MAEEALEEEVTIPKAGLHRPQPSESVTPSGIRRTWRSTPKQPSGIPLRKRNRAPGYESAYQLKGLRNVNLKPSVEDLFHQHPKLVMIYRTYLIMAVASPLIWVLYATIMFHPLEGLTQSLITLQAFFYLPLLFSGIFTLYWMNKYTDTKDNVHSDRYETVVGPLWKQTVVPSNSVMNFRSLTGIHPGNYGWDRHTQQNARNRTGRRTHILE
jgi:hypothetical protein